MDKMQLGDLVDLVPRFYLEMPIARLCLVKGRGGRASGVALPGGAWSRGEEGARELLYECRVKGYGLERSPLLLNLTNRYLCSNDREQ
jgi:hypothetical protein